jgi:predicted secreted protein
LVNRTYIASNTTLLGAPGADVFTFQGTTTGMSKITFNNISPSNQTANNVTYTITCTTLNVPTGNAVLVSSGQNFTLQQPSNPSTGYQWNATYDNSTLMLVNQTFVSGAMNTSTVGVGGTELFTFRGTQMGAGVIVLSEISPGNQTTSTVPYSVIITS